MADKTKAKKVNISEVTGDVTKTTSKSKKLDVVDQLHARDFQNMSDDAIVSQVYIDKTASETNQSSHIANFRRYYQLYRSYIDPKDKKKDRSNLFIPYIFHIIETVTPKLVLTIFKTRPYFRTIALGLPSDIRDNRSKKMDRLLDYQFQQKVNIIALATDILKCSHMYGTAITKQGWNFKERKVIKKKQVVDENTGLSKLQAELVKSVVNDDPFVQLIPIQDFFFDPAGTTIDDCRYCIHRYWMDYNELEDKAKAHPELYRNLDMLTTTESRANDSMSSTPMDTSIGLGISRNRRKGIEIWEYWTDEWVVRVANQSFVIYSQPNPYFHMKKPFAKWVDTPVPNEFYGIGEIEALEQLQNELNTNRNQRIDNVSFVLNKMWKIKRGVNIDTKQLISRPAGFIEVDEMDDVDEIKFEDVTQSAYNEENIIKDDMDKASGVHDTERGTTPQRRETATTSSILANAGNERFGLKTMLAEYGGLHEMLAQVIQLNQQYIDHDKEVLLIGDDGTVTPDIITPEEILGEYTIVGVGSSMDNTVNRDIRQTQLVQLYNIVAARQDINQPALLRTIFEEFQLKNIDKLFEVAPPPQAGGEGGFGGYPIGNTRISQPMAQMGVGIGG